MRPEAIDEARSELKLARKRLAEMQASKRYEDIHEAWGYFLTNYYVVFQKLKKGAQGDAPSLAWFRSLEKFCSGDELLNYLYHARNNADHGLGRSAPLVPPQLEALKDPAAKVSPDRIGKDLIIRLLGNNGQQQARLKFTFPNRAHLVPVIDDRRGGKTYPPPTTHLGQKLQVRRIPDAVELALHFLESKVEEAAGTKR